MSLSIRQGTNGVAAQRHDSGVAEVAAQPVISLSGVRVRYETDRPLVLDIDELTVSSGERIALIGPSGAGKTTLLRLLNGYIGANRGTIKILGSRIDAGGDRKLRDQWPRAQRMRVGFIFQDFSLVDRATVFQNVLWGRLGKVSSWRNLVGWFSRADKMAAMQAIREVDLVEQVSQRADTLSGGQKQRAGLARVLAQEAEIVLADEPISNLDPALSDDMLRLLAEVCDRHGATLLMSLHQPEVARRYAERIIGLRDGRIVYDGDTAGLDGSAIEYIYGRETFEPLEMELQLQAVEVAH